MVTTPKAKFINVKGKLIDLSTPLVMGIVNLTADSFYDGGKGFEIKAPELGSSQQVCGGGSYEGGVGFAIGVDRLILDPNTLN